MLPARPCASGRRELPSPLICLCLCFMIKTPLPSLCFRSLVRRISVFNEPRARISAEVEIRLALESRRGALQGLCGVVAALVVVCVFFEWNREPLRRRRGLSPSAVKQRQLRDWFSLEASRGWVRWCWFYSVSTVVYGCIWLVLECLVESYTVVYGCFKLSSALHLSFRLHHHTARDVSDWSSMAVSLLCSATIPVPVKDCLSRHWCIWCTGSVAAVARFGSVGRRFQALCAAVYKSALVALAKLCYYGNDTKSPGIRGNDENLTFL
ncbi:hypothetical protein DY000_02023392 [Brassica cretica]|uniref:Transmembrane protein n=1 Tax=Brassica cretica TaxID=69181 RepID=A0ABQ7EHX8_BRACR|nr:hypothetical protein DY000_02023392 [Brassica cretica]